MVALAVGVEHLGKRSEVEEHVARVLMVERNHLIMTFGQRKLRMIWKRMKLMSPRKGVFKVSFIKMGLRGRMEQLFQWTNQTMWLI
jgi:hypothetical protein